MRRKKRKKGKILSRLRLFLLEYSKWFLYDASENQIRITKTKKNKFHSFTQLKKHQRKIKIFFVGSFFALLFLLIGLVMGPVILPLQIKSEIYIPNGKGDILLANVSKNQVTVVFKTLDGANENKPLATRAFVEVFEDGNYTKLVSRSAEDDYAVTHIIPIVALREGNVYYIKITAKDASFPNNVKVVSSWGDWNDPIKAYATGEVRSDCASTVASVAQTVEIPTHDEKSLSEKNEKIIAPVAESTEKIQNLDNSEDKNQISDATLHILSVANENHLQPQNKVQTIISWNTNKPATSILEYKEGQAGETKEIVASEEMKTKHLVVLTTMKTGTTYYFNAKSIGENGEAVTSEDYSLRTPQSQPTITDKIVESFKALLRQIKPL